MFNSIQLYIIGALAVLLGFSLWYNNVQSNKIDSLNSNLALQNKEFEDLGTEYAERVKEFHAKKPKVLTRYIKTYISKDTNTSRSSCEDVNAIFDNIRYIGL